MSAGQSVSVDNHAALSLPPLSQYIQLLFTGRVIQLAFTQTIFTEIMKLSNIVAHRLHFIWCGVDVRGSGKESRFQWNKPETCQRHNMKPAVPSAKNQANQAF